MNRRAFILGFGAALAAPAVVRAEHLMPVRRPVFWVPYFDPAPEYNYCRWVLSGYSNLRRRRMTVGMWELDGDSVSIAKAIGETYSDYIIHDRSTQTAWHAPPAYAEPGRVRMSHR